MSPTSHDRIDLTDPQRRELRPAGPGRHAPSNAWRLRALIVLLAADGQPTTAIAASLGVCEDTVRKWRHRWCADTGGGVAAATRNGRGRPPGVHPGAGRRGQGGGLHSHQASGLPLSRWSCPELARQPSPDGICASISTVHGAPLAVRGRAQTLAVPVLDLHHRPRLRRQGQAGAGPLRTGSGTGNR